MFQEDTWLEDVLFCGGQQGNEQQTDKKEKKKEKNPTPLHIAL